MIRTAMRKPGSRAQPEPDPRARELYPPRTGARIRRDRPRRLAAIALVPAILWVQAGARAEPGSPAPASGEPAATEQPIYAAAREHFERGMEHYRAHRYRDAIHEFRLSVARVPNADLWFNMARAYEQLGEAAQAVEHYRLYLRDRVDAPDAEDVQQRIAELYARPDRAGATGGPASGSLALTARDRDLLVLLDGKAVGPTPVERVLELRPGSHRVDATKEGWIPFRAEIEIYPSAVSTAFVELTPRARKAPEPAARPWTWITALGSAGALIAGGMLSLEALDRREAGDLGAADDLELAAGITVGSGLALAIGATLLYFAEARGDEPTARARGGSSPR
jgi:PEGA domain